MTEKTTKKAKPIKVKAKTKPIKKKKSPPKSVKLPVEKKKERKKRSPNKDDLQDLQNELDLVSEGIDEYYTNYAPPDSTGLSVMETMFCLEFIGNGFRKGLAYLHAVGQGEGETRKLAIGTASCSGDRLLKKPHIKNFIQDQLNARCERLQVTSDWVARKYKIWSEIDITQYIDIIQPKTRTGRARLVLKQSLEDLPLAVRSAIKSITMTTAGDLKVEFIDQKAALDSLTKVLGLSVDILEISGKKGGPINLNFDAQDAEA